jgi:6,7-dimethyl-8-ribityllumazine synthase
MATTGNSAISTDANIEKLAGKNCRIVIVRTSWNESILDEMEKGCIRILSEKGIDRVSVLRVPGAVEIPFTIRQCWETLKYRDEKPAAFIALGCVIKGDTPHFDHVCHIVTDGVLKLNLSLPVPVIFGVLTVLTEEQAMARLGGEHGHKGEEAAYTALSMIGLMGKMKSGEF